MVVWLLSCVVIVMVGVVMVEWCVSGGGSDYDSSGGVTMRWFGGVVTVMVGVVMV